jgi:hypothetical protein
MTDINALFKKRDELERERRKIEAEIEKAEDDAAEARRRPLQALAERAHRILCPYNHTDACGWDYENSWNGQAHQSWLRHFDCLTNGERSRPPEATVAQCEAILDAVENLKPKVSTALWLIRSGRLQP